MTDKQRIAKVLLEVGFLEGYNSEGSCYFIREAVEEWEKELGCPSEAVDILAISTNARVEQNFAVLYFDKEGKLIL